MKPPKRKGAPLQVPSVLKAKPCGLPVVGWKHEPQAWWPELPGKNVSARERSSVARTIDWIRDCNRRFEIHTGSQPYVRQAATKRLCRDCHKTEVKGIKRYCPACAKTRNRASYRNSKRSSRSRVQKTGFSPVGAEALTNGL